MGPGVCKHSFAEDFLLKKRRKGHFPLVSECHSVMLRETPNQEEITAADTRAGSRLKLCRTVQIIAEGRTCETKRWHLNCVFPPSPVAEGDSKWL